MTSNLSANVAVAVIADERQRHLWVWNEKWGAFALPMTKLRHGPAGQEAPDRAAIRAGAEALGVPVRVTPGTLRLPLRREHHSGRQWAVQPYVYQVFGVEAHPDFTVRLVPRKPHLWLTPEQALEKGYEPLSESSRSIVYRVLHVFPSPDHALMRRSHSALAVICRPRPGAEPQWLAQWNDHWECFHFVGGHKEHNETFRQCLLREVTQELHLAQGTDFTVDENPVARMEYMAWSERYTADTKYEMELYPVHLTGTNAVMRVTADPFNEWLNTDEIRAGRTASGRKVSETMLQLLEEAGWPCS